MNVFNRLSPYSPYVLSIVRIISALLFFAHGSGKLLGFPALGFSPEVGSLPWIAGVIEIVGGILLTIGLFSRPVAFVLSGLSAFAYFLGHAGKSFFPVLNGGESAVLFCFIFLYLVFAGPGPLSIDAARRKA